MELTKLFKSFLNDRQQRVVFNDQHPKLAQVLYGVC